MSKHPGYGRDGKRLPHVHDMTAEQIRHELVGDAVAGYAAAGGLALLQRQTLMYERLARLTGVSVDEAFNSVLDEVHAITGVRALPVT